MFIEFMNSIVNRIENYYFVKIIDLTSNRRAIYYFYGIYLFHNESMRKLLFL